MYYFILDGEPDNSRHRATSVIEIWKFGDQVFFFKPTKYFKIDFLTPTLRRPTLPAGEFVLAAVRMDGLALRHACTRLRGDHQVVLAAVSLSLAWSNRAVKKTGCGLSLSVV